MFTVKDAEKIATKAHKGQYRHDGETPYIIHPAAVADFLYGEIEQIVGWLHDVLEDSDMSCSELAKKGVPKLAIDTIVTLTQDRHESYLNYILRVKKNKLATMVKLSDMHHNSLTGTKSQRERYELARYILAPYIWEVK